MIFTTQDKLNIVEGITTLKLNFSTRNVLVKLTQLMNENCTVILGRQALAIQCNVSVETIGRALRQLKALEYVSIEPRYAVPEERNNKRVARQYNELVISIHRVSLAIGERKREIQLELERLAA